MFPKIFQGKINILFDFDGASTFFDPCHIVTGYQFLACSRKMVEREKN